VLSLLVEQRRGWSLMIFCARATRAIEDQPGLPLKMRWELGKTHAVED
jgi:hypothetical protein